MLGYGTMASAPYPVEKARALAQAGYYSASIGKNHYYPMRNPHGYHQLVCDEPCSSWFHTSPAGDGASWEDRCDYESWFWSQFPAKDPHATGLSWNDYRGEPFAYEEALHPTYWTAETAIRFLQSYEQPAPFFLKVSFTRPHSPYDPPQRMMRLYQDADIPEAHTGEWSRKWEPRSGPGNEIWHGKLSKQEIRKSRQAYYGNVTFVDEQVGRVLDELDRRGFMRDTLILFLSDHGDMLGDHNLWRKSYGYEPSAHIPMLMKLPEAMECGGTGHVVSNPVELRDIVPTLLDVAGAPIPQSLEGRSLIELLRTGGSGWREFIDLEHDICYGPENHWNGLTDGQWKYLFFAKDGNEQLFDLRNDPSETQDLAGQPGYSQVLREWRNRLVKHLEERGPSWVKNGELIPRPEGMLYSPHFPGYLPVQTTLDRVELAL